MPQPSWNSAYEPGETGQPVLGIPAKKLVRSLAREHYLDVRTSSSCQQVECDIGRLGNGRISIPRQGLEQRLEVLGSHQDFVVLRAEVVSHATGVWQLIPRGLAEARREGEQLGVRALGH